MDTLESRPWALRARLVAWTGSVWVVDRDEYRPTHEAGRRLHDGGREAPNVDGHESGEHRSGFAADPRDPPHDPLPGSGHRGSRRESSWRARCWVWRPRCILTWGRSRSVTWPSRGFGCTGRRLWVIGGLALLVLSSRFGTYQEVARYGGAQPPGLLPDPVLPAGAGAGTLVCRVATDGRRDAGGALLGPLCSASRSSSSRAGPGCWTHGSTTASGFLRAAPTSGRPRRRARE